MSLMEEKKALEIVRGIVEWEIGKTIRKLVGVCKQSVFSYVPTLYKCVYTGCVITVWDYISVFKQGVCIYLLALYQCV